MTLQWRDCPVKRRSTFILIAVAQRRVFPGAWPRFKSRTYLMASWRANQQATARTIPPFLWKNTIHRSRILNVCYPWSTRLAECRDLWICIRHKELSWPVLHGIVVEQGLQPHSGLAYQRSAVARYWTKNTNMKNVNVKCLIAVFTVENW